MAKPEEAPKLLMPKASAIWLIDNTVLTFEQVAEFTGLHKVEVQALADEDVGYGIVGRDPVKNGETTQEELDKSMADNSYIMKLSRNDLPNVKTRAKGPRYTPVSKRADKPNAIAWILKNHSEISDAQIGKLVGTTKPTINAIRDRTHPSASSLAPRNPAELGLCSYAELEASSDKGYRAQGKDPVAIREAKMKELEESQMPDMDSPSTNDGGEVGGFDFSNFLSSGTKSSGE